MSNQQAGAICCSTVRLAARLRHRPHHHAGLLRSNGVLPPHGGQQIWAGRAGALQSETGGLGPSGRGSAESADHDGLAIEVRAAVAQIRIRGLTLHRTKHVPTRATGSRRTPLHKDDDRRKMADSTAAVTSGEPTIVKAEAEAEAVAASTAAAAAAAAAAVVPPAPVKGPAAAVPPGKCAVLSGRLGGGRRTLRNSIEPSIGRALSNTWIDGSIVDPPPPNTTIQTQASSTSSRPGRRRSSF